MSTPRRASVSAKSISPTSVNVIVRFRPSKDTAANDDDKDIVNTDWFNINEKEDSVQITDPRTGNNLYFSYDKIFKGTAQQIDLFNSLSHVVEGCMNGFNGTILAYGQTSSGKTHTMVGYENNLLSESKSLKNCSTVEDKKSLDEKSNDLKIFFLRRGLSLSSSLKKSIKTTKNVMGINNLSPVPAIRKSDSIAAEKRMINANSNAEI